MLNALVKRFLDPLTNNSFILVENKIFIVKCQNQNVKSISKSKYKNNYKYTSFDI